MAPRTLLIDADIFIYQAATNAEIALEWAEDEWTLHAHAGPAKEWIRDKFERLADELKAEASLSPRTGPTVPPPAPRSLPPDSRTANIAKVIVAVRFRGRKNRPFKRMLELVDTSKGTRPQFLPV